jgi:hypothetical protein
VVGSINVRSSEYSQKVFVKKALTQWLASFPSNGSFAFDDLIADFRDQ